MTVIVAKRTTNGIELAWDSYAGTNLKEKTNRLTNIDKHIAGLNFDVLYTGSVSEINLFKLYSRLHAVDKADELSIIEYMLNFKNWYMDKSGNPAVSGVFILVMDNKMFEVDLETLTVLEMNDFVAHGAGRDFALTALYLGHRANKACKVACDLSHWCIGPVKTKFIESKIND